MNVVLWVVAGVLAAAFLSAATLKLGRPKEALAANGMSWVEDFSPGVIRLSGALEGLAAIGLVLPGVIGVATVLVPLAATGLALVMIGAMITHARRHEPPMIAVNAVLLVLAAVVAWGRFRPYSFS